ncbi:MAG: hypothetical protein IPI29_02800 [Ignavibacteria bacterium]|nr:hypothetical protein [Ignavibacteria bacterium]
MKSLILLLVAVGCGVASGQVPVLPVAWTLPPYVAIVNASDSTVVYANGTIVTICDAVSGSIIRSWEAGGRVEAIAFEKHREGVVVAMRLSGDTTRALLISSYSLEGALREVDTLPTSSRPYENNGKLFISPSGNVLVGNGFIYNRKTKSVSQPFERSSYLFHASFGQHDSLLLAYGLTYYIDFKNNAVRYCQRVTRGSKLIGNCPGVGIDQFLHGTNYILSSNGIYDGTNDVLFVELPEIINGIVSSDGMRSIGESRDGYIAVYDIFSGPKYRMPLPYSLYISYVYSAPWSISPNGQVVVLPGQPMPVYIVPPSTQTPRIHAQFESLVVTEHSPKVMTFASLPITKPLEIRVEVDDKPIAGRVYYPKEIGSHSIRVGLFDGNNVVSDTVGQFTVAPLERSKYTTWIGSAGRSIALSPSGDRLAFGAPVPGIVDLDHDSVLMMRSGLVSWETRAVTAFASDNLVVFQSSYRSSDGYGGNEPGPDPWQILHYNVVDLRDLEWAFRSTSFTSNNSQYPTARYRIERATDQYHGRYISYGLSSFLHGNLESGWMNMMTFSEDSNANDVPCWDSPLYVAFDPSQDRPLFLGNLAEDTSKAVRRVWRENATTGECEELPNIPVGPAVFVHNGEYLWVPNHGVYDATSGAQILSARLPKNILAVPHSSLVLEVRNHMSGNSTKSIDLVFYKSTDSIPLRIVNVPGRYYIEASIDTAGARLLVVTGEPNVANIIDLQRLLLDEGLDIYRVEDRPKGLPDTSGGPPRGPSDSHESSYPNPCYDHVTLSFVKKVAGATTVTVVSLQGEIVWNAALADSQQSVSWNLRSTYGTALSSDLYSAIRRTQDGTIIESLTFVVGSE